MKPIVVFDLDDTLYPERSYVLSGFAAVDIWLREQFGECGFLGRATALFESGLRGTIFDVALAQIGLPHTLVASLVTVYRDHIPTIAPFSDAVTALDVLSATYDLGLLTDGYLAPQRRKVKALGVERSLGVIVYSDQFGRENWKPSPIPFQAIMDNAGGNPKLYTYVADNPAKDFIAPRQLGWQTVRIRRPGGEHAQVDLPVPYRADVEINSLDELPLVLAYRSFTVM